MLLPPYIPPSQTGHLTIPDIKSAVIFILLSHIHMEQQGFSLCGRHKTARMNLHMAAVCLASLQIFIYNRKHKMVSERVNSMDGIRECISIWEASYLWCVSKRRANRYCTDGCIPGASRYGCSCAVPEDAKSRLIHAKRIPIKRARGEHHAKIKMEPEYHLHI